MRAVIQRVTGARVVVDGRETASMGRGLLVLLAAGQGDTDREVSWMADKIVNLRIFPDDQDKMNRSLIDMQGEMIVVSQFTLYGDCRKGRRPSFVHALEPQAAENLCSRFIERVRALGISCGSGVFGAHMQVSLTNDGPVTLLVDSSVPRRSKTTGFSETPA
jgi:D-tyrosyl-tRNA(Tyr) deacylase